MSDKEFYGGYPPHHYLYNEIEDHALRAFHEESDDDEYEEERKATIL